MFNMRQFRHRLSQVLCCCAIIVLVVACAIWAHWQRDSMILQKRAVEIVAGLTKPSERIAAINHWVYGNQGFAKNEDYFLVKSFGPTSVQVLESGGDCSD
jgi:hypothetical protein